MTDTTKRYLPLYEAKMIDQYNHRDADVVKSPTAGKRQNQPRYLSDSERADPARSATPMSWVNERDLPPLNEAWLAGFLDVTSTTNERTVRASAFPKVPVGHTLPLIRAEDRAIIVAILNSFALDYVARQKVSGLHLTYGYLMQLPMPHPSRFGEPGPAGTGTLRRWVLQRVLELQWSANDMTEFAADLGDTGAPFVWDPERRFLLRAELDAAFFHLYGVARDDVDYIMDTFPIVRRKDEAAHGEFRTKRVILEVFDAMQAGMDAGVKYQTILDPPPGQGPRHPVSDQEQDGVRRG